MPPQCVWVRALVEIMLQKDNTGSPGGYHDAGVLENAIIHLQPCEAPMWELIRHRDASAPAAQKRHPAQLQGEITHEAGCDLRIRIWHQWDQRKNSAAGSGTTDTGKR